MYCKHDGIEVEHPPKRKKQKTWGKGKLVIWKHVSARDEFGNPHCGRVLTDDDITETLEEA